MLKAFLMISSRWGRATAGGVTSALKWRVFLCIVSLKTMEHKGWHSRHYLPHFDSQDVTQFVTFRLADSLPREAVERLRFEDKPETVRQKMLDRGWGACWLKAEPIAAIVESAFLEFDGRRYRLHAWTIMPNHVHVLFTVLPGASLGSTVGSWKRFTARQANRHLGRTGEFWQTEYWDRYIRNEAHFAAAESYIDENPVKAGLVEEAQLWPHGSARLKP